MSKYSGKCDLYDILAIYDVLVDTDKFADNAMDTLRNWTIRVGYHGEEPASLRDHEKRWFDSALNQCDLCLSLSFTNTKALYYSNLHPSSPPHCFVQYLAYSGCPLNYFANELF